MMTEYMGIHPIRRIRILGDLNDMHGYRVSVFDTDTGNAIGNITRIQISLEVGAMNTAIITYAKVNEYGNINTDTEHNLMRDLVEETVTLDDPELDVTAAEAAL